MSYVPGCSADVFISYAHRDNQDGWVSRLKDKLTEKLNPFLAGRAEVWFDDRIAPGVYFKEEIQQKLRDTPVFIAVVSPSYLDSQYCINDELGYFQNWGKEIIQLLKVPLPADQQVPLPESQFQIVHDKTNGNLLHGKALEKILDEIVAAIAKTLREAWEVRPKIYLAQLGNESLKPRWDELKERLHCGGYAVLPKGILPQRVPDGRIREWLEAARISVHLESVPDDPLAQRQFSLARQIGRPVLALSAPPASDQIPSIIADVQRQLEAHRKPAVYFIYDFYSDHQRVKAIPEFIRNKTGYDVFLPAGGEAHHKSRLRESDGVLLFRCDAPNDWLISHEQMLLQAAARPDRWSVEAKYFTHGANGHSPPLTVTRGLRQELVIDRFGEPNPEDLQPFFDALRSKAKAAGGNA